MGRPKIERSAKEQKKFHAEQLEKRRNRRAKQREEAANQLELERIADAMAGKGELELVEGKVPGTRRGKYQLEAARDAVAEAFEQLGGVDGLVVFGKKYPREFYTQIWSKLIPRVNEAEIGENLEDVLRQLGGGKIPGMHEAALAGPDAVDAEFEEVDDVE
jgi:hypothetical protein